jgi:predicted AAA+ superfamily ATPase
MYPRIFHLDSTTQSFFIFGPRGTGKTSWLKTAYPNALYFDLLHSQTYTEFLGNPNLLESRIPSSYDHWVIIDEIQKIPALLNEVHRLIESKKIKFILTGSSARALRKKGVNLLAGRALTSHMHPLLAEEIGDAFDLNRALMTGLLPMAYQSSQYKRYLSAYVETYLKEEVLQEALTRNINLFARFLAAASFSQGGVLSYTEIAREIGTTRQTVTNFFDILDDLLISIRLPVFSKRAKRSVIAQNKFYYFDVGIYLALRPKGPLDIAEELQGPGLETLFLQHLRAINDYYYLGYEIFFWRTQSQLEVDFILYGDNGLLAFEIKNNARLTHKDFKGLKAFKSDYPMARCYMVYMGDREYFEDDIQIIPMIKILFSLLLVMK